jgi:hypothetical protein
VCLVRGRWLSGRLTYALAALVLLADVAGTIAYLRADHGEQVVEARPAPTPVRLAR